MSTERRDAFAAPFGLDPLFRKIGNKWVRRVAVVMATVLVFGMAGFFVSKALAAEPTPQVNNCDYNSCGPADAWANTKYHEGKMGTDHFAWTKFSNPKEAHKMSLDVIQNKLNSINATMAADSPEAILANSRTAADWLQTITSKTEDCVGQNSYAPYSTGFNLCKYAGGSGSTKEGVQRAGSVIFCAGGVFLAWWTGGGSAIVGFGSTTCLWGAWLSFSP